MNSYIIVYVCGGELCNFFTDAINKEEVLTVYTEHIQNTGEIARHCVISNIIRLNEE